MLAIILAAALVSAPMAQARQGCASCPPTCPMHQKQKPERLRCHGGSTDTGAKRPTGCGARAPGIAPPGCGSAREAALTLPPAILPPPVISSPAPSVADFRLPEMTVGTRGTDPPETPPPITP